MKSKKEKANTNTPIEGSVSRNVDFNLKKEDLMLLILEGKKEVMEEVIAKLQDSKTTSGAELNKAQEIFSKTVRDKVTSLIPTLGQANYCGAEYRVEFFTENHCVEYKDYVTSPIIDSQGSKAGSTYIKSHVVRYTNVSYFTEVRVYLKLTPVVQPVSIKDPMLVEKPMYYSSGHNVNPFEIQVAKFFISKDIQQNMSEFKEAVKKAEEFGKACTKLSDIVTEYDLFSRNQPRAKASMIKEVLSRDAAGQALLANITAAAKGMKLLA